MKTSQEFKAVVSIPLPDAPIWLEEESNAVHAQIRTTLAYTARVRKEELVIEATSSISVADAREALKVWADRVASHMDDEIGYGR